MNEFRIKKLKRVKFTRPVLVEGLPGIGNVARLSVDYLIDKLRAVKFLEVYSDVFPNSVTVTEDSLIKMFTIDFYLARIKGRSIILASGDVQPTSDAESYALCNKIVSLAKSWGVREVITIGGIGLPEVPDRVRVHAVLNDASLKKVLNGLHIVMDGCDTVKIVIGAAGLLLGVAKLGGINGFSLLAETLSRPQHVGVKEARQVLKVLSNYLGFRLDFKALDEDIKGYEHDLKEESHLTKREEPKQRHGYIG